MLRSQANKTQMMGFASRLMALQALLRLGKTTIWKYDVRRGIGIATMIRRWGDM